MKKYPVTYKNKKYEVRWGSNFIPFISIYEERYFLGLKYFKEIYNIYEYELEDYLRKCGIFDTNPNYYIEQAKAIFYLMEQEKTYKAYIKETEQNKRTNLENWDGVL